MMENRTEKYRKVLMSTPMALEVLDDILQTCQFGVTLNGDNPHQIGQYNVAVDILSKCGVFGRGTGPLVIKALSAVMPEQKKENDDE